MWKSITSQYWKQKAIKMKQLIEKQRRLHNLEPENIMKMIQLERRDSIDPLDEEFNQFFVLTHDDIESRNTMDWSDYGKEKNKWYYEQMKRILTVIDEEEEKRRALEERELLRRSRDVADNTTTPVLNSPLPLISPLGIASSLNSSSFSQPTSPEKPLSAGGTGIAGLSGVARLSTLIKPSNTVAKVKSSTAESIWRQELPGNQLTKMSISMKDPNIIFYAPANAPGGAGGAGGGGRAFTPNSARDREGRLVGTPGGENEGREDNEGEREGTASSTLAGLAIQGNPPSSARGGIGSREGGGGGLRSGQATPRMTIHERVTKNDPFCQIGQYEFKRIKFGFMGKSIRYADMLQHEGHHHGRGGRDALDDEDLEFSLDSRMSHSTDEREKGDSHAHHRSSPHRHQHGHRLPHQQQQKQLSSASGDATGSPSSHQLKTAGLERLSSSSNDYSQPHHQNDRGRPSLIEIKEDDHSIATTLSGGSSVDHQNQVSEYLQLINETPAHHQQPKHHHHHHDRIKEEDEEKEDEDEKKKERKDHQRKLKKKVALDDSPLKLNDDISSPLTDNGEAALLSPEIEKRKSLRKSASTDSQQQEDKHTDLKGKGKGKDIASKKKEAEKEEAEQAIKKQASPLKRNLSIRSVRFTEGNKAAETKVSDVSSPTVGRKTMVKQPSLSNLKAKPQLQRQPSSSSNNLSSPPKLKKGLSKANLGVEVSFNDSQMSLLDERKKGEEAKDETPINSPFQLPRHPSYQSGTPMTDEEEAGGLDGETRISTSLPFPELPPVVGPDPAFRRLPSTPDLTEIVDQRESMETPFPSHGSYRAVPRKDGQWELLPSNSAPLFLHDDLSHSDSGAINNNPTIPPSFFIEGKPLAKSSTRNLIDFDRNAMNDSQFFSDRSLLDGLNFDDISEGNESNGFSKYRSSGNSTKEKTEIADLIHDLKATRDETAVQLSAAAIEASSPSKHDMFNPKVTFFPKYFEKDESSSGNRVKAMEDNLRKSLSPSHHQYASTSASLSASFDEIPSSFKHHQNDSVDIIPKTPPTTRLPTMDSAYFHSPSTAHLLHSISEGGGDSPLLPDSFQGKHLMIISNEAQRRASNSIDFNDSSPPVHPQLLHRQFNRASSTVQKVPAIETIHTVSGIALNEIKGETLADREVSELQNELRKFLKSREDVSSSYCLFVSCLYSFPLCFASLVLCRLLTFCFPLLIFVFHYSLGS
jgi:hypothetical protein